MKAMLRRSLLAASLALCASPAIAQNANSPFTQTVFFGDSLTDSGFYRPFLVQVQGPQAALVGQFTANPGYVWSQYLADFYGTDASPAWGLTTTGIAPGTGTNYAAGGATFSARPGFPPSVPTQYAPTIGTQISAYLSANGGHADPDALYTVWGGANDLFYTITPGLGPLNLTQAQFLGAATTKIGLIGTLATAAQSTVPGVAAHLPAAGTCDRSDARRCAIHPGADHA